MAARFSATVLGASMPRILAELASWPRRERGLGRKADALKAAALRLNPGRRGAVWHGKCATTPSPQLFLQECHSRAFKFPILQEYHSKRLSECLFFVAIFSEHA